MTCKTCRFWHQTNHAIEHDVFVEKGQCRKNPPTINNQPLLGMNEKGEVYPLPGEITSRWPETLADDWCGEYEREEIVETTHLSQDEVEEMMRADGVWVEELKPGD